MPQHVPGGTLHVRSADESNALDRSTVPMVIISASGMATGGRVLHHLKVMAPDPRNTILLAGFQAVGTRGAQLMNGAKELNIHGQQVPGMHRSRRCICC